MNHNSQRKALSTPIPASRGRVYAANDDGARTSFNGLPSVMNFGSSKRERATHKVPHMSDKVRLSVLVSHSGGVIE